MPLRLPHSLLLLLLVQVLQLREVEALEQSFEIDYQMVLTFELGDEVLGYGRQREHLIDEVKLQVDGKIITRL